MAPADVGRDSATLLVSAALAEAALEAGCGRCKAYVKTARCVRQKDARPGPDLVCSVACAADGDHAAAVALAARRRLADAAGLQLSLAQQPGLLVTTKGHAAKLAEQGLVQCRGCGGFFSHPRGKGLESHQTSASSACREARLEREADDAKRDGKGDEDGDAAGDNAGDGAAVPWSIGSKSSWRDGSGSTAPPLALCLARDGDLDALKKLSGSVKIGRETDRHGSSALLWASGGGHLEIVKWLVGELKVDGQARSKNGRTALHWAARNGHLNVCAYVVQKCNLGVDDKTNDGDTAFMLAAWQGRLDVCKWLVEDCGADAHSVNRWGCNAVAHAVNTWGCNAAFKAARMDGEGSKLEVLEYVALELNVDASSINVNGHSCLHKAAIYGRGDVVEFLLQRTNCNGREQFSKDLLNQAPSDMARYNGFAQLAARLRHVEDTLWHAPVVWEAPERVCMS